MTTFTIERAHGRHRWCCTVSHDGKPIARWFYRTHIGALIGANLRRVSGLW